MKKTLIMVVVTVVTGNAWAAPTPPPTPLRSLAAAASTNPICAELNNHEVAKGAIGAVGVTVTDTSGKSTDYHYQPFALHGVQCDTDCLQRVANTCKSQLYASSTLPSEPPFTDSAPWQGQVIGGLGEFLASRTKSEVIAWVENLVGTKLCNLTYALPNVKDDTQWFATSCVILKNSEDYGAQKSTGMLAAAIRSDLLNLPKAIGAYAIQLKEKESKWSLSKRAADDLTAAIALIDQVRRGDSPLQIFASFGRSVPLRKQCAANSAAHTKVAPECMFVVGGVIVDFFGGVVIPTNIQRATTANFDDVFTKVFGADDLCKAIAAAFVDPAAAKPTVCDPTQVPAALQPYVQLLALGQDDYAKYKARIQSIATAMVQLEAKVEAVKKAGPTIANLSDVSAALQEIVDASATLIDANAPDKLPEFDSHMKLAADLFKFVGDLQAGDYMAAGQDFIQTTQIDGFLTYAVPKTVKRFLAFVMDVASAKSSDDVAKSIAAVAAPIGGWKLKRERGAISLGAFVGGTGGYEWPVTADLPAGMAHPSGGAAAGLFAPVGVDFSWPDWLTGGLFLSVADVGQVTWSRLSNVTDDSNNTKANIAATSSFAQVVSPGAYLHVGLGNSPFTFGAGVSFAPALRKYTTGGAATVEDLSTVRFGVFLAADITILPLWSAKGD